MAETLEYACGCIGHGYGCRKERSESSWVSVPIRSVRSRRAS